MQRLWQVMISNHDERRRRIATGLQQRMNILGLHDNDIAKTLDVSRETVRLWRIGQRSIKIELVEPLCDLLRITPDILITEHSYHPDLMFIPLELRGVRALRKMPEPQQVATIVFLETMARMAR